MDNYQESDVPGMKGIFKSRTVPLMLLAAVLILSAYSIIRTQTGSRNRATNRYAVITRYYGLSAEDVERIITIPMEDLIAGLPGISRLSAFSSTAMSRIDIILSADTAPATFRAELGELTETCYVAISSKYPAVQRPQIVSSGLHQSAIFSAAVKKGGTTPAELRSIIENELVPLLSKIPGAGEIEIYGGAIPEAQVLFDPEKTAAAGIRISSAAEIMRNSNFYCFAGFAEAGPDEYPVAIDARISTLEELRALPLGSLTKLDDIADISFAGRKPDSLSRINGRQCVSFSVKSSSGQLIHLSQQIRAVVEGFEKQGYECVILEDKGGVLENAFRTTAAALGIGMLSSSLILLLFNAAPRRILLLLLGQPLTVFSALGVLAAAGFTPDSWLLAGLAVSSGMVLDSALLVTAAADGGVYTIEKTLPPLVSSVVSTVTALIPLFGLENRFPGIVPFAASLAAMLLLSLLFSAVFIPPFYRGGTSGTALFILPTEAFLRQKLLKLSLRLSNPLSALLLNTGLAAAGIICLISIPLRLYEPVESPVIFMRLELHAGECLESTAERIADLASDLSENPAITSIQSVAETGRGSLYLEYNSSVSARKDLRNFVTAAADRAGGIFAYTPEAERGEELRLTLSVTGSNVVELRNICRQALTELMKQSWAVSGVLHFREPPPAVHFNVDRQALADTGISAAGLAYFLRWNLYSPVADKWQIGGSEIDLRAGAEKTSLSSIDDLKDLEIPSAETGKMFRLATLGTFNTAVELRNINRLNRQHAESFSISCNKEDPKKLHNQIMDILYEIDLPEGYSFLPSADLIETREFNSMLWRRSLLALLLIFAFLCIERESLTEAVLILLPLPASAGIPLIVLRLLNMDLGSETIIGLILLSGMGINNGILVMSERKEGAEAAVRSRLQSLLLTTVTSVTGAVPLLFTHSCFFTNLAIILISGLSGSFVISLLTYPAIISWYRNQLSFKNSAL
ncbi:MAG: efflux RND transporter permease subunit [Spirochaetales bacterium]|uniref:Efflux RND transporter permease subunit n=1 Tax=Candidatus Thalassospirochaeta sargassi TaxID=3119039 RepID=A0AAJ1IEZ8_9SPIO|nr:efflux RND transporter permease subunit [Spirochaetales bacterium]